MSDAAARVGVDLYRAVDRLTGAKTLFATSGIPGSVGSGTCALWQELGSLLTSRRTFSVWPFEGHLANLLGSTAVVLGEMYPRAVYATALLDGPPTSRPQLIIAKTKPEIRRSAVEALRTVNWVQTNAVSMDNLLEAEANEDDFDACMTAAALLRCELERIPLHSREHVCNRAEGGMLGTGSINLDLPPRMFADDCNRDEVTQRRSAVASKSAGVRDAGRSFPCPISGCEKIFTNTRSGWDAHVGSSRNHTQWHPELTTAEDRRTQFANEFPEFFRE